MTARDPAPARGHTPGKCHNIDEMNISRANLPESASAKEVIRHLEAALMRISLHTQFGCCPWSGSVAHTVLGRTSAARQLLATVRGQP